MYLGLIEVPHMYICTCNVAIICIVTSYFTETCNNAFVTSKLRFPPKTMSDRTSAYARVEE